MLNRMLSVGMFLVAMVPLAIMSVSYLNAVEFSVQTLLVLIVVQAVGGFVGASLVKKLPIQAVRLIMALALLATTGIILARTYIFHVEGGSAVGLTGVRLVTNMNSGLLQLLMIVLMAYSSVSLLREYRKNK